MSITAKIQIQDSEYNVLYFKISAKQEVNEHGYPCSSFIGGFFDIEVENTKDNTLLDWTLQLNVKKDVKITIPSRFGTSSSRIIELKDVYCIALTESFVSSTSKAMTTTIRLSPGAMYQNGKESYIKHWHKPLPKTTKEETQDKEDKEKRVVISFKANSKEVTSGKFGYDNYEDYGNKCTSDKEKLKKEYKPIQVYGKEYLPVWISMRNGQSITLQLDESRRKRYKLFEEIKFEDHPDFTFEPTNLKNADEVTITCNNNNTATAQIKVQGDGETVGAINIFYPVPKKIDLRWMIVSFNEGEVTEVKKVIEKKTVLDDYFKMAFNPALVNINIVNFTEEIVDLNKTITNQSEIAEVARIKEYIKEGTKDQCKSDIDERLRLIGRLDGLHNLRNKDRGKHNEVKLYLTNLKCTVPVKDQEEEGSNNGISVNSASLLFLGNDKKFPKQEIPHEIMHAIGLEHTFKEDKDTPSSKKYIYKKSRTPNYMDYDTKQNRTLYWQWQEIYNSNYAK